MNMEFFNFLANDKIISLKESQAIPHSPQYDSFFHVVNLLSRIIIKVFM